MGRPRTGPIWTGLEAALAPGLLLGEAVGGGLFTGVAVGMDGAAASAGSGGVSSLWEQQLPMSLVVDERGRRGGGGALWKSRGRNFGGEFLEVVVKRRSMHGRKVMT